MRVGRTILMSMILRGSLVARKQTSHEATGRRSGLSESESVVRGGPRETHDGKRVTSGEYPDPVWMQPPLCALMQAVISHGLEGELGDR
jgi:hypothetical protein